MLLVENERRSATDVLNLTSAECPQNYTWTRNQLTEQMAEQEHAWLTAEFMQQVLRNSENDASIKVEDLTTKPAVGKGDNYGSVLVRATVQYSRDESGQKVVENKSLILKIELVMKSLGDDLIGDIFNTEIGMMANHLDTMNEILNEPGYRLSARCLYTQAKNPSLLIIEDLAPLGYRLANRHTRLDLDHVILAIRGLAKFHASSVALYEKDPSVINICSKGVYDENHPQALKDFFSGGLTVIGNEMLTWSELGSSAKTYADKLLKLSKVCFKKGTELFKVKAGEFAVINHGDFWTNNMLFRYDDEGKVTNHIFVDFQTCMWKSPAVDILYFFSTSISDDVELNHRDTVLKEYLDTLTKTMLRIRCKTKPPNMESLKKSLLEYEFVGMMSSLLMMPIMILDKNEVILSFDEIAQLEGGYKNPAYASTEYRKIILRRLPVWDEHGLLD